MNSLFAGIRKTALTGSSTAFKRPALFKPVLPVMSMRFGGSKPSKDEFQNRAIELLRGFEKIDAKKLSLDAHFNKDLGLDSLDTVEVLMAIEDEFLIEIPDQEADNMHTVREAVDFVYERWSPQHYF